MVLHLRRGAPKHSVGVITWRPSDPIQVPPFTPHQQTEYRSTCNTRCLSALLGRDFQTFGELQIISVKLHSHHAKRMELQHFRTSADGSRRLLQRVLALDNFCGYARHSFRRTMSHKVSGPCCSSAFFACILIPSARHPITRGSASSSTMCHQRLKK